jgi:hypothetical protein
VSYLYLYHHKGFPLKRIGRTRILPMRSFVFLRKDVHPQIQSELKLQLACCALFLFPFLLKVNCLIGPTWKEKGLYGPNLSPQPVFREFGILPFPLSPSLSCLSHSFPLLSVYTSISRIVCTFSLDDGHPSRLYCKLCRLQD